MSTAPANFCGPLGAFFAPGVAGSGTPAIGASDASRDVGEAVEMGLGLYRLIHGANGRWADAVRSGRADFNWATAEQFARAYRWWLDGARPVLDAIAQCERRRVPVERADEFRGAFREVSLLPLHLDRVRAAVAAADRGQAVTLDQALDELQNHLQG